MKKALIILWLSASLWLVLSYPQYTYAQTTFPESPANAKFVTTDVSNFWKAFDAFKKGYKGNPFADLYINIGSPGLQDFIPDRILHADSLLNIIKKRTASYAGMRENTEHMLDKEKQTRATFDTLERWYPKAVFPPVYFVIGRFNSAGTSSKNGLIIGAERVLSENVPSIVAHELVHFQQNIPYKYEILLEACIMEGSADFIGELISGNHTNKTAFQYGDAHEKELWKEFKTKMNTMDYTDWLYGSLSGKDKRPNDLGYWIGYQITKAYFNKATDKKKAVADILNISDCRDFLAKSGYAEKFK